HQLRGLPRSFRSGSLMLQIGPFKMPNRLILAPMAGVSDQPFRELCLQQGAGLAVAEMVTCNSANWGSVKNANRLRFSRGHGTNVVKIAGSDAGMMAEAA